MTESIPTSILFWLFAPPIIFVSILLWILAIASPFLIYQWIKDKLSMTQIGGVITRVVSLTFFICWIYILYLLIPSFFMVIIESFSLLQQINRTTAWGIILVISIPPFLPLLIKKSSKIKLNPSIFRWLSIARVYVFIAALFLLYASLNLSNNCSYEMTVSGRSLPVEFGCR
jgi:hypothetical protein